jgi:hypothetical protein
MTCSQNNAVRTRANTDNSRGKWEGQEPQRNLEPGNVECSNQHSRLGPKWAISKLRQRH